MKTLPPLSLPKLKSFSIKYTQVHTRFEADHLCGWIKQVISTSDNLQILRFICENEGSSSNVNFDGLVSHLIAEHPASLRILDLGSEFIGGNVFEQLCTICDKIEELTVRVGRDTLVSDVFFLYA